jgi:hypothetical protein
MSDQSASTPPLLLAHPNHMHAFVLGSEGHTAGPKLATDTSSNFSETTFSTKRMKISTRW